MNLLNVFLEWLPSVSLNLLLLFRLLHLLPVWSHISCSTLVVSLFAFSFFSAFCCLTFLSAGMATVISRHVFCFFNYYIWPICHTYAVCNPPFRYTVTYSCSHTGLALSVCTVFHSFRCLVLRILNNLNMHQPYRVSLATRSSSNVASWGKVVNSFFMLFT